MWGRLSSLRGLAALNQAGWKACSTLHLFHRSCSAPCRLPGHVLYFWEEAGCFDGKNLLTDHSADSTATGGAVFQHTTRL